MLFVLLVFFVAVPLGRHVMHYTVWNQNDKIS